MDKRYKTLGFVILAALAALLIALFATGYFDADPSAPRSDVVTPPATQLAP